MRISKEYLEVSSNNENTLSATSKGNQTKYVYDNKWYKEDYLGYEGLSEVLCSRLANAINFPYSILEYSPCFICRYPKGDVNGCYSYNFTTEYIKEITLYRILESYDESVLEIILNSKEDTSNRIKLLVDTIINITGLSNFGEYLTSILEFDRLVLNEDRHLHNILLLYNSSSNNYEYAPLFDNGAALLSDTTRDYQIGIRLYDAIKKIKAKPFNNKFDKQVIAAQSLYGKQLNPDLNIELCIADLMDMYHDVIPRVCELLRNQFRHYYPETNLVIQTKLNNNECVNNTNNDYTSYFD